MSNYRVLVAIDVSGSMAGWKIEATRSHAKSVLHALATSGVVADVWTFAESVVEESLPMADGLCVRSETEDWQVLMESACKWIDTTAAESHGLLLYTDCLLPLSEVATDARVQQCGKIRKLINPRVGVLVAPPLSRQRREKRDFPLPLTEVFDIYCDPARIVSDICVNAIPFISVSTTQ